MSLFLSGSGSPAPPPHVCLSPIPSQFCCLFLFVVFLSFAYLCLSDSVRPETLKGPVYKLQAIVPVVLFLLAAGHLHAKITLAKAMSVSPVAALPFPSLLASLLPSAAAPGPCARGFLQLQEHTWSRPGAENQHPPFPAAAAACHQLIGAGGQNAQCLCSWGMQGANGSGHASREIQIQVLQAKYETNMNR